MRFNKYESALTSSTILILLLFANFHHASNPLGGARPYRLVYSITACGSVLDCLQLQHLPPRHTPPGVPLELILPFALTLLHQLLDRMPPSRVFQSLLLLLLQHCGTLLDLLM